VFAPGRLRPFLQLIVRELNGITARSTNEVVVMIANFAQTKEGLTVGSPNDIDLTPLGHRLEIPIDGCQADLRPPAAKGVVQLLGAQERTGSL
jgi:hypothetical protein